MADTLLLSLASRRRPGTVILVGFEIALAGRLRLGSWGIILEFCHIALIEYILRDKGRHLPYLQKNGLSSTELPYLRPLPTAVMVCGKSNGTETF